MRLRRYLLYRLRRTIGHAIANKTPQRCRREGEDPEVRLSQMALHSAQASAIEGLKYSNKS